jgi:hypothetical protein
VESKSRSRLEAKIAKLEFELKIQRDADAAEDKLREELETMITAIETVGLKGVDGLDPVESAESHR